MKKTVIADPDYSVQGISSQTKLLIQHYGFILIFLLSFSLYPFESDAKEKYMSSRMDGSCHRSMIVSSLGKYTSLHDRKGHLLISKPPVAGDGIILHMKFSSSGSCKHDHFLLRVETSNYLKITGKPASKGTKNLIESGDWPDNEWNGDLMWSFSSSQKAYKNTQWVRVELLNAKTYKKLLGGKSYVTFIPPPKNISKNKPFIKRKFKGIYLDYPNDISTLNEKYGSHFKPTAGTTAFDSFSRLDIHYIVVNNIAKYFSINLGTSREKALKTETIKFIHYIKRVRPDIKIWFAVPSWWFTLPGNRFSELITWINSVNAIDGMVLDWETNPKSIKKDIPSIFRLVRKLLVKKKKFICTPTSFIGRRGLYWNEVDSKHSGCDLFLPMFYIPQQDDFLVTGKQWLDSWNNPKNKPSSPIIPLLIPIHKVTDNTPMPSSLIKNTVDLISNYNYLDFFVYRPYAVTQKVKNFLANIYGDFNVDFTLDMEHMYVEAGKDKFKINGSIVNRGMTKTLFPVPLDIVISNAHKVPEIIHLKVDLKNGKTGKFSQIIKRTLATTEIKIILDPAVKYLPKELKFNEPNFEGQRIFSISPKWINIPETNEENNCYSYTKIKGRYQWYRCQ